MKRLSSLLLVLLLAGCVSAPPAPRVVGPWDLALTQRPVVVTHGTRTGLVEDLYCEGEPRNGKPTRVFAYLGRPATNTDRKLPAMLLVHGGGGKAFREWAEHWAQRGYVALAMDLSGNGPAGALPSACSAPMAGPNSAMARCIIRCSAEMSSVIPSP